MKTISTSISLVLLLLGTVTFAQEESIIEDILKEAEENSQLEILAQELLYGIGPRLVGTPQMKKEHDWAVEKYTQWGHRGKKRKLWYLARLGKRNIAYRYVTTSSPEFTWNATRLESFYFQKRNNSRSYNFARGNQPRRI